MTEGKEGAPSALDVIRREAERCDSLQGFQFVHSPSGGTGSGLVCLLGERLRETFPERILTSYAVLPPPRAFRI
jgi:tubulin beta